MTNEIVNFVGRHSVDKAVNLPRTTGDLADAAAHFNECRQNDKWRALSQKIRQTLGISEDAHVYLAGEQTLLFGGTVKLLGKLLTLRQLKVIDPQAVSIFYLLSGDAAKSNRECYRTFLPSSNGGKVFGFPKNTFRFGFPCYASYVETERIRDIAKKIARNFGKSKPPEWLIPGLGASEERKSISEFNIAFLQNVSNLLSITPDFWLEDWRTESLFAGAAEAMPPFLNLCSDFNLACTNAAEELGYPPQETDTAPFWIIENGKARRKLRIEGNLLYDQRDPLSPRTLADGIHDNKWRVVMRSLPRILFLSLWVDAQVVGSGSTYNYIAQKAGETLGRPIMPRWVWPKDGVIGNVPPFQDVPMQYENVPVGMLAYLMGVDWKIEARRLQDIVSKTHFQSTFTR